MSRMRNQVRETDGRQTQGRIGAGELQSDEAAAGQGTRGKCKHQQASTHVSVSHSSSPDAQSPQHWRGQRDTLVAIARIGAQRETVHRRSRRVRLRLTKAGSQSRRSDVHKRLTFVPVW